MSKEKDNIVTKPLIAAQEIQEMVKKNTEDMMKDIISEAVKNEMKKMITEDEDNRYEEEDVEDVKSETPAADDSTETIETTEEVPDFEVGEEDGDWADADQFKVDDDTYDLSDANDEDIIKVYKLMKDDDSILVKQTDDSIEITDKESGNTYLVKDMDNVEVVDDGEAVFEVDMSRIGEALNEDNLGYTTTYQGRTAMTTPPVSPEPSPTDVNDWNAGVPTTGDNVQRFGKPGEGRPFDNAVKEDEDMSGESVITEDELDEAGLTRTKGNLRQRAGVKSEPQIDNTAEKRVAGTRQGTKLTPPHTSTTVNTNQTNTTTVTEQKLKQLENVVKGLREKNTLLKEAVKEFQGYANDYYKAAQVAGITNYKMGRIVKLFTEHSTTLNEKRTIVERFEKEVKTTDQINNLYETIKSELDNKKAINESMNTTNLPITQKMNESSIYVNDEVRESLDFMNRLNKIG